MTDFGGGSIAIMVATLGATAIFEWRAARAHSEAYHIFYEIVATFCIIATLALGASVASFLALPSLITNTGLIYGVSIFVMILSLFFTALYLLFFALFPKLRKQFRWR